METKKFLWPILAVYLLILLNVTLKVNGAAVETTTESLTPEKELITEQVPEIEPYTTTKANECICNCDNQVPIVECAAKDHAESSKDGGQLDTNENSTAEPAVETETEKDVSTDSANAAPVGTTASDNIDSETTAPNLNAQNNYDDIDGILPTPTPACSIPGLQAHETDCHAFYDCTSAGSIDGSLQRLTKFCAPNQAFNTEFNACSRDISTCTNPVVCTVKGGLADPTSNTSYYLCEPRLIGGGFHVFHVICSENQIFYPALGKCYLDFKNLNLQPLQGINPLYYNWNQIEDIDLVKAELKVLQENDKLKVKLEKEKLKAEQKLQKEAAKEAERLAKEQDKLLKAQIKQESELFVCPQAGNFASTISNTAYYSCTLKKTRLKKTSMKCALGSKFDSVSGICVADGSGLPIVNATKEDDD